MAHRYYSADDFANDSFFVRWVRKADDESEWFWNSFIEENPSCIEQMEKARELIISQWKDEDSTKI